MLAIFPKLCKVSSWRGHILGCQCATYLFVYFTNGRHNKIKFARPFIYFVFDGNFNQGDTMKVSSLNKGHTIFLLVGKKIGLTIFWSFKDDAKLK
jgi:hypothetical protein